MALIKQNQTLASDFVSLKARVKAEMQRRKYTGSLAKYAGVEWDYIVQPTVGEKLLPEHYNKIIEPLNAIAPTGYDNAVSQGIHAIAIKAAFDKLAEYEKKSTGGATDCAASCSGLCYTSCGSDCSITCGGCDYWCSTSCSGGCDTTCTSTCQSECQAKCGGQCGVQCGYSCYLSCRGNCGKNCSGSSSGTSNPGTGA